jgi:hypothetical protein
MAQRRGKRYWIVIFALAVLLAGLGLIIRAALPLADEPGVKASAFVAGGVLMALGVLTILLIDRRDRARNRAGNSVEEPSKLE